MERKADGEGRGTKPAEGLDEVGVETDPPYEITTDGDSTRTGSEGGSAGREWNVPTVVDESTNAADGTTADNEGVTGARGAAAAPDDTEGSACNRCGGMDRDRALALMEASAAAEEGETSRSGPRAGGAHSIAGSDGSNRRRRLLEGDTPNPSSGVSSDVRERIAATSTTLASEAAESIERLLNGPPTDGSDSVIVGNMLRGNGATGAADALAGDTNGTG